MSHPLSPIVNLLHEAGMLAEIPRSGFAFLGSGSQSVAEHSFRVAITAYTLATMTDQPVDRYKLTMLCLFHDLPESRIGDLNYVQKRYVTPHLDKALNDIKSGSPLGPEVVIWIKEYEEGSSIESQLAGDADQLELLLMLQIEHEKGNSRAIEWIQNALRRLKTPAGKALAEAINKTPTDQWWNRSNVSDE